MKYLLLFFNLVNKYLLNLYYVPELLRGSLSRIGRILTDLHPVCEVRWVGGGGEGAVENLRPENRFECFHCCGFAVISKALEPPAQGPWAPHRSSSDRPKSLMDVGAAHLRANRSLLLYHVAVILYLRQCSLEDYEIPEGRTVV